MAQETWTTRDLPVLDYVVERVDAGERRLTPAMIAEALEMEEDLVARALEALSRPDAVYVDGHRSGSVAGFLFVTKISSAARRATGAWPGSADSPARLADALTALADREPEGSPERTRLQKAAAAIGGVGQSALNAAISAAVGASMG